jgi:hypothetical protein
LIQNVEEEKFSQIFSDNKKSAQLTTLAYANGQWSKKSCNYAVSKPHKITKYLPAGTLLLFRMVMATGNQITEFTRLLKLSVSKKI